MKEIHYKLLEIASRLGLEPEEVEKIVCDMVVSSDYRCSKVDLFNMLKYFEKNNLLLNSIPNSPKSRFLLYKLSQIVLWP